MGKQSTQKGKGLNRGIFYRMSMEKTSIIIYIFLQRVTITRFNIVKFLIYSIGG
jgi:hypothetical protein